MSCESANPAVRGPAPQKRNLTLDARLAGGRPICYRGVGTPPARGPTTRFPPTGNHTGRFLVCGNQVRSPLIPAAGADGRVRVPAAGVMSEYSSGDDGGAGHGDLHDEVDDLVNLDVDELEAFKDSSYNEAYLESASAAAQPGDEPLDDAIRLLETDRSDYRDVDDGFNEVEEGEELINYHARVQAQIDSQGLGTNYLTDEENMTKREAASIRWGVDPDDEREWL